MVNILQITAHVLNMETVELWTDIMEVPPEFNNMVEFLEVAKNHSPDRKVRIIQIMEI